MSGAPPPHPPELEMAQRAIFPEPEVAQRAISPEPEVARSATSSSSQSLVQSKRFRRECSDSENGTEQPLARCLHWIRTGGRGGSPPRVFVALAHETAHNNREYEALSESALRRWAEMPQLERHAHEVIWTSTKLYADVDVDWQLNPNAEAMFTAFVDVLVAAAAERFSVECDVLVLDASVAGVKFSRHLVVTMRRRSDGAYAAFETSRHCGAFIRLVECAHGFDRSNIVAAGGSTSSGGPLCDPAVYRSNNCLRMYGSDKPGQDRPFVPLNVVDRRARRDTLDYDVLERSLVTYPRVTDAHALLRVTDDELAAPPLSRSATASRENSRKRKSPSSSSSSNFTQPVTSSVEHVINAIAPIVGADIRSSSLSDDGAVAIVRCKSRACAHRAGGGEHRSNSIYFVVDLARARYKQQCYSQKCRRPTSWTPFPDDARSLSAELSIARSTLSASAPLPSSNDTLAVASSGAPLTKSASAVCNPNHRRALSWLCFPD